MMKSRIFHRVAISFMVFVLVSCNLGQEPSGNVSQVAPDTPQSSDQIEDSALPVDTEEIPGVEEPIAVTDPTLAIMGGEEVVWEWATDSCERNDYTDLPMRSFRDADGNVQMIRSFFVNHRSIGPDMEHLTHKCEAILGSHMDPDPAHYNDHEWIASTYTEDGQTIYALVHNEYQGNSHPGRCPQNSYSPCWYNAITLAVSNDGGQTYDHLPAPDHLVAAMPIPYEAGEGPYGIMGGSNIIKGKDGYYYTFVHIVAYGVAEQHACLMRTDDLSDPKSWRAWDGEGFNMTFINPYKEPDAPREEHTCEPIRGKNLNMHESITYNTYLDRYVFLGIEAVHRSGVPVFGITYTLSEDLIHWSEPVQLIEMPLSAHVPFGSVDALAYPVLFDPNSDSLNFETTGKLAYIYYTRFNYGSGVSYQDMDLVRFPVEFFPNPEVAKENDARTVVQFQADPLDDGSLQISGRLKTKNQAPVPNQSVEFSATPLDGEGEVYEYTLTGTVPDEASRAVVGIRINTECSCSAPGNFTVYEFRYQEGGSEVDIPNGDFTYRLSNWWVWGTADGGVEASDQGEGNMLVIQASEDQAAAINSPSFNVTAGEEFTLTIVARILPASAGSGFFGIFFLNSSNNEYQRFQVAIKPSSIPLGLVTTDENGEFEIITDALPQGKYSISGKFSGSPSYFRSTYVREVSISQ